MAVKFAYIDIDEEVYVASSKPFDMNNLEPDPEGYTKEIVENSKIFIKICEKKEYYNASAWTTLNETFNPIMDKIRSEQTDPETKKRTEYYQTEIQPVLKNIQVYISYIRETYKENTLLFELAKKIDPGYTASSPESVFYTDWIYNELKEKRIDDTDVGTTKKYLELFTDISKTEKLKIKDFTIRTLYDKLEELGLLRSTQGINERERDIIKGKIKGAVIIHQEGDWTVYKVSTEECAKVLGSNTNWCTAKDMARRYLDKCGYLIIFYFKGRPYSQLEPSSGEFKDRKNIKITTTDYPPYTLQDPILYEIFNKTKDDLLDKPIRYNKSSLKDTVLPAHKPEDVWLQKVSKFKPSEIHEKLKEIQINRYKILEPQVFMEDASLMITEPYMKAWAESKEGRDSNLEELIKEKSNWALSYACNIIQGSWPEAEATIFKSDEWDDYVRYALKKTIVTFLSEKFNTDYKGSFDNFLNAYRAVQEICNNLKDYQRQYLEGSVFFSSVLSINAESADWLLYSCLENYTKIPKDIKISEKDGLVTEIVSTATGKAYTFTKLTQKIYDKIKEMQETQMKNEFDVSIENTRIFIKRTLSYSRQSKIEAINNALPRDTNFEKKFDIISAHSNIHHSSELWFYLLTEPRRSSTSNMTDKEKSKLKSFLGTWGNVDDRYWEILQAIRNKYGPPLDVFFCYFIYSDFYDRKRLLELKNLLLKEGRAGRPQQTELVDYGLLLIEKALINNETSSDFWDGNLLTALKGKKSELLEKRKNRNKKLIDEIIENIANPEVRGEFKKLLDPEYKRTNVKNTSVLFIEILNMLDQAKIPNKETVELAFNIARESGDLKNILENWSVESSGTIPEIIAKFYKKNAGFIDLFDMLNLDYLITPDTISAADYFNPFISKGLGRYSKNNILTSAYYLNKIKDIPDFKVWISNVEKTFKNGALDKKYILNTLEKEALNFQLSDGNFVQISEIGDDLSQNLYYEGEYLIAFNNDLKLLDKNEMNSTSLAIVLFVTKKTDSLQILPSVPNSKLKQWGLTPEDLEKSLNNLKKLKINQILKLSGRMQSLKSGDYCYVYEGRLKINSLSSLVPSFLYSPEKATEPKNKKISISEALDNLSEAQYNSAESSITDESVKIIISRVLNQSELSVLFKTCPGLFIQYINLYKFEASEKEYVDKLILRSIESAHLMSRAVNLQTHSGDRKNAPGFIIGQLLPYMAAHHSEQSDVFIDRLSELMSKGTIGHYVSKEQVKARIIREIKRFNK